MYIQYICIYNVEHPKTVKQQNYHGNHFTVLKTTFCMKLSASQLRTVKCTDAILLKKGRRDPERPLWLLLFLAAGIQYFYGFLLLVFVVVFIFVLVPLSVVVVVVAGIGSFHCSQFSIKSSQVFIHDMTRPLPCCLHLCAHLHSKTRTSNHHFLSPKSVDKFIRFWFWQKIPPKRRRQHGVHPATPALPKRLSSSPWRKPVRPTYPVTRGSWGHNCHK